MRRLLLRGFTQFGTRFDDTKQLQFMMLFHRLCVTVPFAGNRMFEEGDEKIFKLNRNKGKYSPNFVPIPA